MYLRKGQFLNNDLVTFNTSDNAVQRSYERKPRTEPRLSDGRSAGRTDGRERRKLKLTAPGEIGMGYDNSDGLSLGPGPPAPSRYGAEAISLQTFERAGSLQCTSGLHVHRLLTLQASKGNSLRRYLRPQATFRHR